jgi:Protein of unknown function (DUF3570)
MDMKTKSKTTRMTRKKFSIWQLMPLGLACGAPQVLRAENQLDYRYGYYDEDANRMKIETHSAHFEQKLIDSIVAKGDFVYDGVSGATPTGTLVNGRAKIQQIEKDIRRAANAGLDWTAGINTFSPGLAYSAESDYHSFGVSLGDALSLNQKNTTLQFGISHNFDSVLHNSRSTWSDKDSTDGLIGIYQLLSPNTILNLDLTLGYESGYLTDPYRLANYKPSFLPFDIGTPEIRPGYRSKEVVYTAITHYVKNPWLNNSDASFDLSYRFYHDSYDIYSHTLNFGWHQWLGKHFILEPFARFYYQTAASFYSPEFLDPLPSYVSSDYRLSEFYSTDFGIEATAVINDHLKVIGGYHRYSMRGLDHTTQDMYPQANVFSIGVSFSW